MKDDIIVDILERKNEGIDCTEEESAQIKGWLRETTIQIGTNDQAILEDIQLLFPQEYGEWLDETE